MMTKLPEITEGWAFFLDVDGTLIDIAPTPDAVIVPPGLPGMLESLLAKTGGALALLTGRSIETIDRLFAPARLPIGAIHGAEIRFADGEVLATSAAPALAGIRTRLADFVAARPGMLLEDKGSAVAVHYRAVPELHDAIEAEIRSAVAAADHGLAVQPGKMVFEIRPAGANKGEALVRFMSRTAFAGRRPIAVGDDLTDETMFATALRLGGYASRVGMAANSSSATMDFSNPSEVRNWISRIITS